MVKFFIGEKGEGKTKKLIEMANDTIKDSHGHTVFIDADNRHMYDLHYDIRFVETSDFPLSNYRELIGFIFGILSQDSDIEIVFVDGLYNIVENISREDLIKLAIKLKSISEKYSIEFIISANISDDDVPVEIKDMVYDEQG